MKKIKFGALFMFVLSLGISFVAWGQRESDPQEKSLAEQIDLLKGRQDKFHFYMHTHMSADARWTPDKVNPFGFNARELRMEAKGNITERFSYRLMYRLNAMQDATRSVDGQASSLDVAGIGIRFNDQWSTFFGRQCAAYGGIQFDYNPVQVYEYVDILNTLPIFLTGAKVSYEPAKGQQLQLQVLNAQTDNLKNAYKNIPEAPKFNEALIPLDYTFNWNGSFFNNMLHTRWSYSYIQETEKHSSQYIALGNLFNVGPIEGYFDAMFARIGLNAQRLLPEWEDCEYHAYVLKGKYSLDHRWKIFAKGMYESGWKSLGTAWGNAEQRTSSWAYVGGIEYFPISNSDLHFFLLYSGRKNNFLNTNTSAYNHRVALGFIWQIPVF